MRAHFGYGTEGKEFLRESRHSVVGVRYLREARVPPGERCGSALLNL
jgi:hypothetical protein